MKKIFTYLMRTTVPLLILLLTATTAWADTETVSYIDADGNSPSVTATVLTGSEGILGSNGTTTWYVVSNDISYTHSIDCYGNVNIILTDGKTMSVSNNGVAIRGEHNNILTIYGQHNGTGTLTATSTSAYGYGIFSDSVIVINGGTITATGQYGIHCDSILINGGTVTATGEVVGIYASHRVTHNITINGGKVTATGAWAIHANGGIITLGWRNNSDFIKVSEYNGTVNIKDGQALINGTNIYRGNNVNIPDNVTLTPANFTDDGDDTYTIWSAVGWGMFCDALQDNTTYNRFSGKTVKLNNDIGTLEDPITRMAGSSNHDFCGTFDGQGHTVTVNLHSDERDYAGLFCYVSETTPTGSSQVSHPFIMNLEVAGYLTTTKDCTGGLVGSYWGKLTVWRCIGNVDIRTNNKHAGGLIGAAQGNAEINNCSCIGAIISSVEGDGTQGGIIGQVNNGVTVEITGCLFGGSLIGSSTTHCSGFVGYNGGTLIINGSLLYPGQLSVSGTGSATFARGNAPTINQSYYTQLLGEAQGTAAREITAGDNVTIGSKALSGETVVYNVSGITAYRKGGLKCSSESTSELFFGEGDTIELELSYAEVPGYVFDHYTVTGGGTILAQTETSVSLVMTDADQTIGAAYTENKATLSESDDNATWISDHAGLVYDITLTRTLYKDGSWNTLCLPFALDAEQVTAQLAPSALMTLSSTSLEGGTLTMTFADATTIEAGKPYVIKWAAADNLVNPVFSDVTVSDAVANIETTYADFKGNCAPVVFDTENKGVLFLGAGNTLYYPDGTEPTTVNAFRGYFELKNIEVGAGAPALRIVSNLNDATGVTEVRGQMEDVRAEKVLKDGVLYILRGGVVYDVLGRVIQER